MSAIRCWFCIGIGVLGVVAGLAVPETRAADRDLLVSTTDNRSVMRFDGVTGISRGPFVSPGSGGLRRAVGMTYGPDGNLYVGDSGGQYTPANVKRYNGRTGAFIDTFVSDGGLFGVLDMVFGPDGNLYVTSAWPPIQLRCYHGTTGALIDVFAPYGGPDLALAAFKGDILYTIGRPGVLRYSVKTRAFLDVFVADSSIFDATNGMVFGPDGNLYVTYYDQVLRFNGTTGALIDVFVKPGTLSSSPVGLVFGPDGDLYVVSYYGNRVQRYDGTTGTPLGPFASVPTPWDLVFMPHPADFDADEDVDIADFGRFQVCATGPAVPYNPAALPPGCKMPLDADGHIAADFDKDGDVDADDFGVFQRCYNGQNRPAGTRCLE
ncbi:MAG TPA: hypothetical protein PKY77_24565 [Phycisphaerae bacterium]|nr:hypothetical protein [Phycisphaerae bacterium]HSA29787.1 hypothetical protein [Phycisphaerae bacterium]